MTDAAPADPRRWFVLAVVLAAEIVDVLDSTVVNVAGPSLREGLGASPTDLQWVIGGYPLALGAGLILGGRLGDRFGRRQIFLVGLAGFVISSLACGLSPSIGVLIAARLIQGAFGALMLPQGFGLIREVFPPKEFGAAFAVYGPVFGLAGILGPLIGGGLIELDLFGAGWRSIFFVNLPIGVAAFVIARAVLPKTPPERHLRIDVAGAALVIAASALLVLPLIQGQQLGWPLWTWLSLAAAAAGYGAFVLQQRQRVRTGRAPLVVPTIFRKSPYVVGLAGIALFFAGSTGVQLIFTLFLQIGEGFSAGQAGLGTLPLAIGSGIGGAVSGAILADRLGRGALQIGAVLQLAGALLLRFLVVPGDFSIWQAIPGLLIGGVGQGMVVAALFNIILAAVDDEESGSASGVLSAVQSVSASVGVALFGTIFFSRLSAGDPGAGFQWAIVLQAALLVVFLVLSPLFPKRARADA